MWNPEKMVETIPFAKQKQRHRRREQSYGYHFKKQGGIIQEKKYLQHIADKECEYKYIKNFFNQ